MSEHTKGSTFEELYLQQRKKSSMLLIAVIVLAISTAGSLAWGFSKGSGSQPNTPGNFQGQGFNGGQGGPGGFAGPGRGLDVKQFFNDDGSVNNDEVKSFLDRIPSGGPSGSSSNFNFLDRFKETINQAATDGDITQDQADALIQAFETESES